MNLNRRKIFLLFFAVGLALLLAYGFYPAKAAPVVSFSDSLSSHVTSAGSNHTIVFITPSGVDAGETITVEFNSAFSIGTVDYADIDFTDDGVDLDLDSTASGTVWGASFAGNILTLTSDTGSILPNSIINIKIGNNASYGVLGVEQITNPSIENSYGIVIDGTFGDHGSGAVYVMDNNTVTISARVLEKNVKAIVQWAMPQLRVGSVETNDDERFFIKVMTPADDDDMVLFTMNSIVTSTVSGTYFTVIPLTGITSGTYDVGFKGAQHLTKKLNDIDLVENTNTLNFTQLDNSAPKGDIHLVAGDINGAGTDPSNLGDDKVNSVDIAALLSVLNVYDADGNGIRANLNQDTKVNSVDLSMMVGNLNMVGDR